MNFRCDCIVMSKHESRCSRQATKICTHCGDRLCGGCAKNHHAHPQQVITLEEYKDLNNVEHL